MKLSEVSIHRPVFATVMSLVVMLVGLVGYSRLSVREYPNIDQPVVTVTTDYPGASAEIVETQVTKVLEDSLSGIEGIDYLTSISRQEDSQITVRFKLERDPDEAAADVRDRVARVRGQLPDEIDEPVIEKVEADAQPIIYIAFSSDRHSALEITDYADRYVKDRLQTLPGVADVPIFGERDTPCASGSIPSGSPPTSSRSRTSRTRSAGRTSRSRPAASRAAARVHRARRDRPQHAGAVRRSSCSRT